jgi:hypothetical protein
MSSAHTPRSKNANESDNENLVCTRNKNRIYSTAKVSGVVSTKVSDLSVRRPKQTSRRGLIKGCTNQSCKLVRQNLMPMVVLSRMLSLLLALSTCVDVISDDIRVIMPNIPTNNIIISALPGVIPPHRSYYASSLRMDSTKVHPISGTYDMSVNTHNNFDIESASNNFDIESQKPEIINQVSQSQIAMKSQMVKSKMCVSEEKSEEKSYQFKMVSAVKELMAGDNQEYNVKSCNLNPRISSNQVAPISQMASLSLDRLVDATRAGGSSSSHINTRKSLVTNASQRRVRNSCYRWNETNQNSSNEIVSTKVKVGVVLPPMLKPSMKDHDAKRGLAQTELEMELRQKMRDLEISYDPLEMQVRQKMRDLEISYDPLVQNVGENNVGENVGAGLIRENNGENNVENYNGVQSNSGSSESTQWRHSPPPEDEERKVLYSDHSTAPVDDNDEKSNSPHASHFESTSQNQNIVSNQNSQNQNPVHDQHGTYDLGHIEYGSTRHDKMAHTKWFRGVHNTVVAYDSHYGNAYASDYGTEVNDKVIVPVSLVSPVIIRAKTAKTIPKTIPKLLHEWREAISRSSSDNPRPNLIQANLFLKEQQMFHLFANLFLKEQQMFRYFLPLWLSPQEMLRLLLI